MQTVKYSIRKLFQEGGATRRIGSRSNPAVPLEGAYIPVQLPGETKARVALIEDVFSDSPAFFLVMVKSKAFGIVPGTAVYNESNKLVSANVIWADGTPGVVSYNYTDENGSYEFTAAKTTGGATPKTAREVVTRDGDGNDIGTIIGEVGEDVALVAQPLPFTAKQFKTVSLTENTGVQKLTFSPLTAKVQIISEAHFEVSANGITWDFFAEVDPAVSHDFYVRIKDTETASDVEGKLHFQSEGSIAGECALIGHIGDGTETYPFPVVIPYQLNDVRNDLAADYAQYADINMSSFGDYITPGTMLGNYDGQGYTISNITLAESGAHCGIFGQMSGNISNLNVTNATTKECTIENCYAGILASHITGIVTNCRINGTVNNPVGHSGLVAGAAVSLNMVSGEGTVIGAYSAGGLAGTITMNATKCCFRGTINVPTGSICIAGGLAGTASDATIEDCYAIGTINGGGDANAAGLAWDVNAYGSGSINNVFCAIVVNDVLSAYGVASPDGMEMLVADGMYWDIEATLIANDGNGATPLSTSDSKQKSSFPEFDFEEVWDVEDAESYPFLRWENAQ